MTCLVLHAPTQQVIRGTYDPMPEAYSPALRQVIQLMLARDLRTRPAASDLLIHPAVVPYVQVRKHSVSQTLMARKHAELSHCMHTRRMVQLVPVYRYFSLYHSFDDTLSHCVATTGHVYV